MLHLKENERVDWFRIMSDLQRSGVSTIRASKELNIPKSTIQGWVQGVGNPRLETGMRVINFWAKTCHRKVADVPTYDIFQPYSECIRL